MRPYDGAADDFHNRGNGSNDWNPSRTHSIEEVPIALGFLVVCNGDFEQSIFGGTNYGRDCDSIAGMAGSIAGALHGNGAIRSEWIEQMQAANRFDYTKLATAMTQLIVKLQQKQADNVRKREAAFDKLVT